ncbi:MAG: ribokinase, partial [Opitutales bacterium]|nr:ribokinase [Opitutales bacterium]
MKRFCVIGSLNVDLIVTADRLPRPSETVIAKDFQINTAGGKGANQAVALARLGENVSLVGKIGDKFHGPDYFELLKDANVDCQLIDIVPGYPGIATIGVDKNGENSILVYPGANQKLDTHYIDHEWEKIVAHDIFLLQLEIPIETVIYTVKRLREAGKTIILDPAPAQLLPDSLISAVDYLTPNLLELEALANLPVGDEEKINLAAAQLIERGAKKVITKAGPGGAYITEADSTRNRA